MKPAAQAARATRIGEDAGALRAAICPLSQFLDTEKHRGSRVRCAWCCSCAKSVRSEGHGEGAAQSSRRVPESRPSYCVSKKVGT